MIRSSEPRSLRFRVSGLIRHAMLKALGIPYSRHGLDEGLVPFLPEAQPIAVIDIGASSGDFTARVIDHCGVTRALLVEAQPARCQELRDRFHETGFIIEHCAVSDRTGTIDMDILNFDYSSSILPVLPSVGDAGHRHDLTVRERVTVPTRTLDALVAGAGFTGTIDLLKIDTQGAELLVLKGAVAVLPRVRMIWAEVSFRALYDGSALFADVHGFLAEQGFRLHSIHAGFRGSDGELLQGDALFLSASVRTGPA